MRGRLTARKEPETDVERVERDGATWAELTTVLEAVNG